MKENLFENYNSKAYENSTDPFGAILEGPTFTYGDKSGANSDVDPEGLGREENGAHSRKIDTDYDWRKMNDSRPTDKVNDFDVDVPEIDPYYPYNMDDETVTGAGTRILHNNGFDADGRSYSDIMDHVNDAMLDASPLGDSDVLETESGFEVAPGSADQPGNPLEDEMVIGSEEVLSAPEEDAIDDAVEDTTDIKSAETLSSISTEELLKELEYRLKNKE